jgi:hypothetical protein
MNHLYSWVEPSRPPFISTLRLIELVDLPLKDVKNVARRAAVLELGSEWVCEKVLLHASFVRSQGTIEDMLEVEG